MAVKLLERAQSTTVEALHAELPVWRYRMYGLTVYSQVLLPFEHLGKVERDAPPPDLLFRRAQRGQQAPAPDGPEIYRHDCVEHGKDLQVHRGPGGAWIWYRAFGTCHVLPGARTAIVYPAETADEQMLALLLAGQVSVFMLHQLGRPTLHASAVVTGFGAVCFLGAMGQGKSTTAGCFLKRGHTLITDDVLPLESRGDAVYGLPSLPYMKVWPKTATGALDLDENLPTLLQDYEKRLLTTSGRFSFAVDPVPIRAFYILDRFDPVDDGDRNLTITPISAREGMATLLAQISVGAFLQPAEAGRLLPLYARLVAQAPVRKLRFPNGFEHHDAVYSAVLMDAARPV